MKFIHYFFKKKTVWKTTWIGKFSILILMLILFFGMKGLWLNVITSFVTAEDTTKKAEAIVIEHWNRPSRSSINTAFRLLSEGIGKAVFVTEYSFTKGKPVNGIEIPRYYREILALYFKSEGFDIGQVTMIPVTVKDPVTWNTANDVTDFLKHQGITSMILLTPWYHSRRSCDVYLELGKGKGITVFCKPVEGEINRENWWRSHNGLDAVFSEVAKRLFYIVAVR
ncbi:MAG: hypothetical protein N2745_11390 [Syntrophorhabdaceae bacterium]|nr:hypothetical protein [Syntrophorhabdaceae bacterium]